MSLADVFVAVKPDLTKFPAEMGRGLDRQGAAIGKHGEKAGDSYKRGFGGAIAGLGAAVGGVFAAMKVKDFFADSIAEARESIKVGKLTTAVLKSTGGAARVSAADVNSLADALSKKTGIDDEVIQSGENLLLTFTNVRNEAGKGNDIFNRTTGIMQDMSVALGQDTKSSAIQLGKALNDPIKGVTALQRVGVSFTKSQKEQIKALVESGDTMGAQKLILGELTKEFGGAAEAAATPADKARVAWGNFKESVGKTLLPVLGRLADWFTNKALPAVQGLFDLVAKGDFTGNLKKAFGITEDSGFVDFILTARDAIKDFFQDWKDGTGVAGGIREALAKVIDKVKEIVGWLVDHKEAVAGFVGTFLTLVGAFKLIMKTWQIVSAVLSISPLGLIILGIAALVAYIIHLWKTNETFRDNVTKAWESIKTKWNEITTNFNLRILEIKGWWAELQLKIAGAKQWFSDLGKNIAGFWQGVKDTFREGIRIVVKWFLDMVGNLLRGAANAFGWVPGIGPKLKTAADKFDKFKNDVNKSLSKVEDKDVTLRAKFEATKGPGGWVAGIKLGARGGPVEGGTPGKDSVPYLLMPGEFIVDREGRNLPDALGHYGVPGMAEGGVVPRRGLRLLSRLPTAATINRRVDSKFLEMFKAVGERAMEALAATGIFSGVSGMGGVGAGVTRWSGIVLKVLALLHQSASWLGTVLQRMQRESGGNPYAINLWDINARNGDPSRGLMQTIGATFAAYSNGYRSRGIYDPFANIFAALNYTLHRYGTLASLSRPGGYDAGGILQPGALGLNSTSRPERVLSPSQTALFERLVAGGTLGNSYTINIAPTPLAHPADIGKAVVQSIQEFERANGSRWRK